MEDFSDLKFKIIILIYSITVVLLIGMGFIYFTRTTCMPYHEEAMGIPWPDLMPCIQLIILSSMKFVAAGFIVTGAATAILLIFPFRKGELWSYYAIPFLLLIHLTISLYVTLNIHLVTQAATPWKSTLTLIVAIVIAMIVSIRGKLK